MEAALSSAEKRILPRAHVGSRRDRLGTMARYADRRKSHVVLEPGWSGSRISGRYKAKPKGVRYAAVSTRPTLAFALQGWQRVRRRGRYFDTSKGRTRSRETCATKLAWDHVSPLSNRPAQVGPSFSDQAESWLKTVSTWVYRSARRLVNVKSAAMPKEQRKLKVHSLTGRITPELMRKSFKAVKRNRGAAGLDKVSINMYEANLEQNLDALMRDLKTESYRPLPLLRKYIPKGTRGEVRPLGVPAVRDRVAQEVVRCLLDKVFEPKFHPASFGFRKFRNCHMAIQRVLELADDGFTFVVDADIKGFFDNIPHDLIMRLVGDEIADGKVLRHIERFLKAGVLEDGFVKPTRKGTPQGGVISPLLANIVLDVLDWKLEAKGIQFVRYADDFVLLCRTQAEAEKALTTVRQIVEGDLRLELHPEKTRITSYSCGFEFLGFFLSQHTRQMRDKAVENFKTKVRGLTIRSHNLDNDVIVKLNRLIRGTLNYFGAVFATGDNLFRGFDKWIRKRLRCMKFKRISRADHMKMRVKHFNRLGLLRAQLLFHLAKGRGPGSRLPGNLAGVARCPKGARR